MSTEGFQLMDFPARWVDFGGPNPLSGRNLSRPSRLLRRRLLESVAQLNSVRKRRPDGPSGRPPGRLLRQRELPSRMQSTWKKTAPLSTAGS